MTDTQETKFDSKNLEAERAAMNDEMRPILDSYRTIDPTDPEAIQAALEKTADAVFNHDHETVDEALADYGAFSDILEQTLYKRILHELTESRGGADQADKSYKFDPQTIVEARAQRDDVLRKARKTSILVSHVEAFAARKFIDEYAPMIADARDNTFSFPYYRIFKPFTDEQFMTELFTEGSQTNKAAAATGGKIELFREAVLSINQDYETLMQNTGEGLTIEPSDLEKVWQETLEKMDSDPQDVTTYLSNDLVNLFIYEVDKARPLPSLERIVQAGQLSLSVMPFEFEPLGKTSGKYRLMVLLCSMGLGNKLYILLRGDETKTVTAIVQNPIDERINDHSLAFYGLENALTTFAWWSDAENEPVHYEKPKRGRSNEIYEYRPAGDTKAYADYFATPGATPALFGMIYNTAISIIHHPETACFIDDEGMLNVTANRIIEESRRTLGGKPRGRDDERGRDIVNAAMVAISRTFFGGYAASGKLIKTGYAMVAVYAEHVIHKGTVYTDVWIINPKYEGIYGIALERDQTWRYPLPDKAGAISLEEASIRDQVNRWTFQLRDKVYGRGKTPKKRPQHLELSWDKIFENHSELGKTPDYRKKGKLIKDYDAVLKEVADMESRGLINDERPLYLTARTIPKPSRGRAGKAPDKLYIEAVGTFHKPRIDITKY